MSTQDMEVLAERSRRGKAANTRGKTTEQAVVRWLRENGFSGAERTVRTGYRTKSRVSRDLGDVDGTPGVVWQIKSRETDNVGAWMDETLQQRQAASADVGVLIVRRAGKADPGRWWAWVPLLFLHGPVRSMSMTRRHWMTPVRLELADLVTLLRSRGYGDSLPEHTPETSALNQGAFRRSLERDTAELHRDAAVRRIANRWQSGDPEPVGVQTIRDVQGDVWTRREDGLWETPETRPYAWDHVVKKWGPVTEANG